MGKAFVVTSGKGGVGKTTATANLGTALAILGKSVVVVDADIGLRNLDIVMGLESRVVYSSMDVILGKCELGKALVKDRRSENLYLLAASQRDDKTSVQPEQMRKICMELKEDHDFVLIDSPAGIEQGFQNAAAGADAAIVVTTPDVAAVRDADRIIGLLQGRDLKEISLVLNRLDMQMVRKGDMMDREDVVDILSVRLLGVIPEDGSVVVSSNRGLPLTLGRDTEAANAFKRIAQRMTGEDIPIPEFSNDNWFTGLIKRLWRS